MEHPEPPAPPRNEPPASEKQRLLIEIYSLRVQNMELMAAYARLRMLIEQQEILP